jgi:pantothenate kinase type III
MRKETRQQFKSYVSQIALLNGIDPEDTVAKFSVAPVVEQTLEEKIQESSDFLQQINSWACPSSRAPKWA